MEIKQKTADDMIHASIASTHHVGIATPKGVRLETQKKQTADDIIVEIMERCGVSMTRDKNSPDFAN
ncbi:MAG: hypothetical protein UR39_C0009G0001 [Candidatus Woesebacteria bacterium GW2011_GWA1_33_30]|uniref:Uncharacterized protein n=1 Tax=Candidatus Woesebacteria bacterium GW2011_GWA2_33_28 TaxID=1618561 RepID=A0A0F9ZRC8_9BACT|nr:MAG: hypothetical protein UR38_C0009G0001 [Candidatus Woesebacteria bacterium GW2011_GWA2_33_28]KKP47530.1 MAG: hypothetical protein UR39_C0009G0001 [Candidatus Woesebacteria bacterium GW2011_GWA1_33_30]KKP49142.1 MAG: hypothetical protein UR40_C0010G0001 [Microgenomates group bacterium GW2011_GWC1_33_32]KKP51524.1 MAG: hypothetical protein UR44_C0009G0001 [Candidatus Woesebacteria bacterium GW2011_GWB1_33_38]